MNKKTAIIIILLAVVILIAVLFFFYFRNNTDNTPGTTNLGGITFPTSGNDTIFGTGDDTDTQGTVDTPVAVADIRQIFSEPTSGAIVVESSEGPKVRFVERSNGNVHDNVLSTNEVVRISNTTIPKIQEVLWGGNENTLIYRYLKDETDIIETFSARIKLSTSTSNEINGEVVGTFLPTNIKTLAISKSDNKIIYAQDKVTGEGSIIYTSNIDGTSKKQILDTKLRDITLSWPKSSSAIFFTNPSYRYLGFAYELAPTSGSFEKILGDASGLIPLPNNTISKILYSQSVTGSPSLKIFDITDGTDSDLAVKTLANKCVWSNVSSNRVYCAVPKTLPDLSYPDAWYQGIASFSDDIWEINTETRSAKLIALIDEEEYGALDMVQPILSKDDSYIVFTNKADLSLWTIKIK